MKIMVINGPNINMIGIREPDIYGKQTFSDLLALQRADFYSKGVLGNGPDFDRVQALLEEISREDACLSLKDLAVNGHDLMALGIRGREIGETLNRLLEKVIDEELPNAREVLLEYVKTLGGEA